MIYSLRRFVATCVIVTFAYSAPGAIDSAFGQEYAYVANRTAATITIIATEDQSVVRTLDVEFAVEALAMHPNGRILYVVYNGFVGVYETTNYTRLELVPVGSGSVGIALTPDGKYAYISGTPVNSVSVLDTETNTVVATIPVSTTPRGIAITPDGKIVYVSNSDTGVVSVIETATNTVTATVQTGVSPEGIAVSPDGSRAYVANFDDDNVSVVQTSDHTVVHSFGLGGGPTALAFSPDGAYLYGVSATDDSLTVFDAGPDTVLARINVGAINHRGIAVAGDGKSVYVPNLNANSVSIIEFGADTTTTMVDADTSPWTVVIGVRVDVTATEPPTTPAQRFSLSSLYPSPFSKDVGFEYTATEPAAARLDIFDVSGRLVSTRDLGWSATGVNRHSWDGRNGAGVDAPPGLYFLRLQVGDRVATARVIKASNVVRSL
ncbi:MAG: beta-propeller fold lactonase family protein [Rhodothermales bacterium]